MSTDKHFISRWIAHLLGNASSAEPAAAPTENQETSLLEQARSRNGYLREQAMPGLAKLGTTIAIFELLSRVNDWVPQVRLAARHALHMLMTEQNASLFIEHLPELEKLASQRRDNHAPLIEQVTAYLLQPGHVHHLIGAISDNKPRVARIAARLCMRHALLPPQELAALCLASSDTPTRLTVLPLLENIKGDEGKALLDLALKNTCMPLRRAAFVIYCKELPEQSHAIARTLLFDRSASLRLLAIDVLQKRGADVISGLLAVLSNDADSINRRRHAVSGLVYVNAIQSIPAIALQQFSLEPLLRRAALLALATLDKAQAPMKMRAGLNDPSLLVARACARHIAKARIAFSMEDLLHLARNAVTSQHQTIVVQLARQLNKWDWLAMLLEMSLLLSPTQAAQMVDNEFVHWNRDFNRDNSWLTTERARQIHQLLQQGGNLLPPARRKVIEFSIGAQLRS